MARKRPPKGFNEAAARCRGKLLTKQWKALHGWCFNEAAARCRGKQLFWFQTNAYMLHASMRPRPDAAENPRPPTRPRSAPACFNEAAARCRGKQALPLGPSTLSPTLQ